MKSAIFLTAALTLTGCCTTCQLKDYRFTPEQMDFFEHRAAIGRANAADHCFVKVRQGLYGDDIFSARLDNLLLDTDRAITDYCDEQKRPLPPIPKQWEDDYWRWTDATRYALSKAKLSAICDPVVAHLPPRSIEKGEAWSDCIYQAQISEVRRKHTK